MVARGGIFSYKTIKFRGSNVQHGDTVNNTVLYIESCYENKALMFSLQQHEQENGKCVS